MTKAAVIVKGDWAVWRGEEPGRGVAGGLSGGNSPPRPPAEGSSRRIHARTPGRSSSPPARSWCTSPQANIWRGI